MGKKMLINATHPEENRVAIVEDGILTELDIEIAGKEQSRGNVYKAVVVRVEPGLQAAFVDYGGERFGFLQMGEIHPSYFRNGDSEGDMRRQRITDVLRRGQELLVQVVKEERGTKGAALTTFLSLPGRYMVLMPDSDTKGVSRKIEEESQRKKLKEAMASLNLPAHMGYIVRTAGIGQKKEELKRDFDYLVRVWEKIREEASRTRAPALIYKESNLVIRSIRDYFTAEMDEVLVDDPRVCEEAKDFFQQVMPEYARLVKLHQEKRPIFARYQIEEQIETINKNKVPLPSGGSIVIDATEALVAVDVNSGKMAGESNVEATAYRTNLEAAIETARQLRLRDLGGLIVIDFIDMRDRKHIREVEKTLKDALKYDKARVTVGRISQFGLLEMSRQRIKAALAEGSFLPCPHCGGGGRIKSPEAQAIAFLRKVHAAVAKGQVGRLEGEIPLEVATYLLNMKREELVDMERRHQMMIVIKGRPDFVAGQAEITTQKREKDELPGLDLPTLAALPMLPTAELPARIRSAEPPPKAKAPAPFAAAATIPAAEPPPETPAAAEEPAAATEAADLEESAAESGKKKRKRRRKKKKTGETAAAETTAAETFETEADEEAEAIEEEATATAAESGEKRKKKRRRKKKKAGEAAAEELPIAAEAPAAEAVEASGAVAEEEEGGPEEGAEAAAGEPGEERKKKRRRRRKKKPGAPADAAEPAIAAALETEPVPPATGREAAALAPAPALAEESPRAEVAPSPANEGDAQPAPKGRRTRKKVEKTAEPAIAAAPQTEAAPPAAAPGGSPIATPAAEAAPASAEPAAPAPAKKAKGKRGGKPAASATPSAEEAPQTAEGLPAAAAAAAEAPLAPETPEEPAAAPARRPRPRRSSVKKETPATADTAAATAMEAPVKQEAPAAATTIEEKPKRRPPRKKASTSKKAEGDAPAE